MAGDSVGTEFPLGLVDDNFDALISVEVLTPLPTAASTSMQPVAGFPCCRERQHMFKWSVIEMIVYGASQ